MTMSAFACAGAVTRAPVSLQTNFLCGKTAGMTTSLPRRSIMPRMTLADEPVGEPPMGDSAPPPGPTGEMGTEDAKLFVGNLSWDTTDHSLGDAFSRYGNVVAARVVTDRFTGKSRGFGFIEYETANCANDALEGMNGYEVDGRRIRVDRANKRPPRPRREQY